MDAELQNAIDELAERERSESHQIWDPSHEAVYTALQHLFQGSRGESFPSESLTPPS